MSVTSITLQTSARVQFIVIDHHVRKAIEKDKLIEGAVLVFVPHTTAGVTINENADPDVVCDLSSGLSKMAPFADQYKHVEGNSAAHIKSSLIGPSLSLIVAAGQLVLGVWQSIYFCEFDGPRTRQLYIKTIKD